MCLSFQCLSFFDPNLITLQQKTGCFIKISLILFGSYDDHMAVMGLKYWELHHSSMHELPCTLVIFLTKSLKISPTENYFKNVFVGSSYDPIMLSCQRNFDKPPRFFLPKRYEIWIEK